jgi:hypothetical protein
MRRGGGVGSRDAFRQGIHDAIWDCDDGTGGGADVRSGSDMVDSSNRFSA